MQHYTKAIFRILGSFILSFILSGCGSSKDTVYRNLSKGDPSPKQYAGHYKVGEPYTIHKKTYTPKKAQKYAEVGMCSWYGSKQFHGKKTANGDTYNKNMLTAAHPSLPMPSLVEVTNVENNKSLVVMVNDRGPFKKNRIIDVSEEAAKILGFKHRGVAKVKVKYLHEESKELLSKLDLKDVSGSKSTRKMKNAKCSVNCHIKLVNMKRKLPVTVQKT